MLLEIEHLTKVYRGGVRANDDISLAVEAGEVFGLLGPNGAGKTTLVSQVLGSVLPSAGSITIDGVDIVRQPALARKACSYQPQASVPVDGTSPLEAIELVGRIRGENKANVRRRARELIDVLQLGQWADMLTPLSGGVARLVAFCMAAIVPGKIVVLDEPTNDIDPLRRKLLWQQVRALANDGSAVLLVTHNVLEAERCVDRLAIIDSGRVVLSGTAASLKAEQGRSLRLELVLEAGIAEPPHPPYLHRAALSGRRLIGEIDMSFLSEAIAWAGELRDTRVVEEFSVGPITLEDVYVRQVASTDGERESHSVVAA